MTARNKDERYLAANCEAMLRLCSHVSGDAVKIYNIMLSTLHPKKDGEQYVLVTDITYGQLRKYFKKHAHVEDRILELKAYGAILMTPGYPGKASEYTLGHIVDKINVLFIESMGVAPTATSDKSEQPIAPTATSVAPTATSEGQHVAPGARYVAPRARAVAPRASTYNPSNPSNPILNNPCTPQKSEPANTNPEYLELLAKKEMYMFILHDTSEGKVVSLKKYGVVHSNGKTRDMLSDVETKLATLKSSESVDAGASPSSSLVGPNKNSESNSLPASNKETECSANNVPDELDRLLYSEHNAPVTNSKATRSPSKGSTYAGQPDRYTDEHETPEQRIKRIESQRRLEEERRQQLATLGYDV